jgi:hypothetical protein
MKIKLEKKLLMGLKKKIINLAGLAHWQEERKISCEAC